MIVLVVLGSVLAWQGQTTIDEDDLCASYDAYESAIRDEAASISERRFRLSEMADATRRFQSADQATDERLESAAQQLDRVRGASYATARDAMAAAAPIARVCGRNQSGGSPWWNQD